MKDSTTEKIDEVLVNVMHRYRNFFLGPGINMDEYSVPLRQRPDFVAPLVTVMGYTFGLKSVRLEDDYGIEVSGNVYSPGFTLERFRERVRQEFNSKNAPLIMKNFAEKKDYEHVSDKKTAKADEGLSQFAEYFEFTPDENIQLTTKKKKEESKVTKKMEDVILQQTFRIRKEHLNRLLKSPELFASAVYLFCLRLFVSAYRKSL